MSNVVFENVVGIVGEFCGEVIGVFVCWVVEVIEGDVIED